MRAATLRFQTALSDQFIRDLSIVDVTDELITASLPVMDAIRTQDPMVVGRIVLRLLEALELRVLEGKGEFQREEPKEAEAAGYCELLQISIERAEA